jgi:hypothetical protein
MSKKPSERLAELEKEELEKIVNKYPLAGGAAYRCGAAEIALAKANALARYLDEQHHEAELTARGMSRKLF